MPKHLGLHHVALFVTSLEKSVHFFTEYFAMKIEWQPDSDNVYLTSGNDNFALHRAPKALISGMLDHIGFIVASEQTVDEWYDFLIKKKVKCFTKPKTHRDGARSFYCSDPSGIKVQVIFHPPIVKEYSA